MRTVLFRWAWMPLFLATGILLFVVHTTDPALEAIMMFPALLGAVLFVGAHSEHTSVEIQLQDMSKAARWRLVAAAFAAAGILALGHWHNPYVQYYLHRFDPFETAVLLVVVVGGLKWVVTNAPRI